MTVLICCAGNRRPIGINRLRTTALLDVQQCESWDINLLTRLDARKIRPHGDIFSSS